MQGHSCVIKDGAFEPLALSFIAFLYPTAMAQGHDPNGFKLMF